MADLERRGDSQSGRKERLQRLTEEIDKCNNDLFIIKQQVNIIIPRPKAEKVLSDDGAPFVRSTVATANGCRWRAVNTQLGQAGERGSKDAGRLALGWGARMSQGGRELVPRTPTVGRSGRIGGPPGLEASKAPRLYHRVASRVRPNDSVPPLT